MTIKQSWDITKDLRKQIRIKYIGTKDDELELHKVENIIRNSITASRRKLLSIQQGFDGNDTIGRDSIHIQFIRSCGRVL